MILEWLPPKEFYKLPVTVEKKSWRFPYFCKSYCQRKIGTFLWATLYKRRVLLIWSLSSFFENDFFTMDTGILTVCHYWQSITGFKLTYRDSVNATHFSIFTMQIFSPSQKITISKYNVVSYSEAEKLFFPAIKNNFNMPGVDKSRTCVRYALEIINFTNCRTWLFSNKYVHEHNFSVSWILKQS